MKAKNLLKMAVAAFLISGMGASNAMAAGSSGDAEALVLVPISLTKTQDLIFGGIIADAINTGTVTVDAATGALGSTTVTTTTPTTAQRATFAVVGEINKNYTSGVDPSVTLVGPGSPGTDMVATLTKDSATSLDAGGNDILGVGGSLAVAANQGAGSYTGTFNVTANY